MTDAAMMWESRTRRAGRVRGSERSPASGGRPARPVGAGVLAFSIALTSAFLAVLVALPAHAQAATLYVGGSGPGNYTTIRDAAVAAQTGDTIFVYSGVYQEASFALRFGVSLIGEDQATTIIEGIPAPVISLSPWSNISGFTLRTTAPGFRGLWLWFADNATIENMTIDGYTHGIYMNNTAGVTLSNNSLLGTGVFILGTYSNRLRYWNAHTIDSSNTVNGKPVYYWKDRVGGTVPAGAGQVILANVTDVTVAGQAIDNGTESIQVGFSSDVTISGNSVSRCNEDAIGLFYSTRNRVSGNSLSDCSNGVLLWSSTKNEIADNRLERNSVAIHGVASPGNAVVGNLIPDSAYAGIWFEASSPDNTIADNTVASATFGVRSGNDRTIVVNNTVSGNERGILVLGSECTVARNVAFGNQQVGIEVDGSSNLIAGNAAYSNIGNGIQLYGARQSTVVGNNVSRNYLGIALGSSTVENVVVNNTISNNNYGITVGALSRGDTLFRNNVTGNSIAGISVVMSIDVTVTENTVAYNALGVSGSYGIYLDRSSGIRVFHNSIVENERQGFDSGGNSWDDGYPSGGNYWSDYAGIDDCSGPAQTTCPNPDGIGDTPYILVGGQDRYPLMGSPSPGPVPPSQPWKLFAASGDRSVTLSWEAPTFDGGAPVTNYRIYRGTSPGGEGFLTDTGSLTTLVDTGLTNGVTYYYRVSAKNVAGEGPMSLEASARPASVTGNARAICEIVAPSPGSTVSGTYPVTGTATDPDGSVLRVEVRIDDGAWLTATGTNPWLYDWYTLSVPDGAHSLHARAYDGIAYSEEASVVVTVRNSVSQPQETPIWQQSWFVGTLVAVAIATVLILGLLRRRAKKNPKARRD